MNHAIAVAGALAAAGLALGGGAIGGAIGDAMGISAFMNGIARQPEAQGRLFIWMFLVIGLAEAFYFINLALIFYFINSVAGAVH